MTKAVQKREPIVGLHLQQPLQTYCFSMFFGSTAIQDSNEKPSVVNFLCFGQDGSNIAPRCPKDDPKMARGGPRWLQDQPLSYLSSMFKCAGCFFGCFDSRNRHISKCPQVALNRTVKKAGEQQHIFGSQKTPCVSLTHNKDFKAVGVVILTYVDVVSNTKANLDEDCYYR